MGFTDLSPKGLDDNWTIALVREPSDGRETHFGLFASSTEAREAMESGAIRVMEDQKLQLRRIRPFPKN